MAYSCRSFGLKEVGCQKNPASPVAKWELKLGANMQLDIWVFPKIGVPQNRWLIVENPIKMHDLGVPLFLETSIW